MDSRNFIRTAEALIDDINRFSKTEMPVEQEHVQGEAIQKNLNAAFTSLYNPTLFTAEKLVDTALDAGFSVNPQVTHRVKQAQGVWPHL